jgi:hypothetical protein
VDSWRAKFAALRSTCFRRAPSGLEDCALDYRCSSCWVDSDAADRQASSLSGLNLRGDLSTCSCYPPRRATIPSSNARWVRRFPYFRLSMLARRLATLVAAPGRLSGPASRSRAVATKRAQRLRPSRYPIEPISGLLPWDSNGELADTATTKSPLGREYGHCRTLSG